MTIKNLLLEYTNKKLANGFEPNSPKEEIEDFIGYFEQFMILDETINSRVNYGLTIDKNLLNINDGVFMPTYEFTNNDLDFLVNLNLEEKNQLEIVIKNYLKKLPKRKEKKLEYTKEEIDFAKHATCLIIEFIWDNYINYYIDAGKWPMQCRDINKYLFEIDLASLIEVPSIRESILKFYEETTAKIMTLKKEDSNFKLSKLSDSLLAKANSNFITDGYDDLFKYSRKRVIELDGEEGTFTNRACADGIFVHEDVIYSDISLRKEKIGNVKTKKIIDTINNL